MKPTSSHGYTLIEAIGVLAILLIAATFVGDAVFSRLRRAEQQAEAATLQSLAKAFDKVVLERHLLPGTNDWPSWLAPEVDASPDRLQQTRAGGQRLLVYHPASPIRPGATARFQTASGFTLGSNAVERAILVSLRHGPFPAAFQTTSTASFDALWNRQPLQHPAGWPAASLHDPADLQVVRLDLRPHLHRVTLNDLSSSTNGFSLTQADNGTVVSVTPSFPRQPWQAWFLHGTSLDLHAASTTSDHREWILNDTTLYLGDTGWNPDRQPPDPSTIRTFVADFLNADFLDAVNQQRPEAVIHELYRAIWAYMAWEETGFVEGGNNKKQAPAAYVVRSTIARLNQGSLNLIGYGGGGGGNGNGNGNGKDK